MVPAVLKVQNPEVKAVHAYWFSTQFLYLVIFNIISGCDAITGCNAGKSLMLISPPHT